MVSSYARNCGIGRAIWHGGNSICGIPGAAVLCSSLRECSYHDGQRPIPLSRIGREYDRNWSPVLVQNTGLERRIQSVLDSERSISTSYLLSLTRFWHDLPTYSGPEQETNSAHILHLFWAAVLTVACRVWGFDRLRPFKFCSMIRARGPTKRSLLMCRQQSGRRRFDNGSTSERWVL